MKFLSVVCSALLVLFVGNLIQAPAAVEQPVPIVNPQPAPVPDDAGAVVPIIEIGCPGGNCDGGRCGVPAVTSTTPESAPNNGGSERVGKPVRRAAAAPVKVAGKLVKLVAGRERRQARRAAR